MVRRLSGLVRRVDFESTRGRVRLRGGWILVLLLGNLITGTAVAATSTLPWGSLYFTMTAGGSNPLPQVVGITPVGADTEVSPNETTSSGGNWLSTSGPCFNCTTPATYSVTVNAPKLAPGVYTGQVAFSGATTSLIVSVTLTVVDGSGPFLGPLPGGLSFVSGGAFVAPPQTLSIVSPTPGAVNWTASVAGFPTTANWLRVSATTGTAPSTVTVSVVPQGIGAGTYLGEVIFQVG